MPAANPTASSRGLLRLMTCGSVDDGKSTLIGRLLHDAKVLHDDQLAALQADSPQAGGGEAALDFSLLVDGLAAEREQGITIDVAYRFFATARRSFIVADAPGHEQYTRNMVTAASTADLAVILVDARKGVLTQTRRHSHIAHLLGVRRLVLAVNKMDAIGFDQVAFDAIVAEYAGFARSLGLDEVTAIPLSALRGDNVFARSTAMPWYQGPTLVEHLETVDTADETGQDASLRLPVQWVNRAGADFRGFSGLIAAGAVRPGDAVRVMPAGTPGTIARVVAPGGDLKSAVAGQSVTVTLSSEVDCARGDVIVAADDPAGVADQFEATIIWMVEQELLPGRPYWLKLATRTVGVTVQQIKHQVNVNSLEPLAAKTLALNAIGVVNFATDQPVVFEPYATNRTLGGFILIDRVSNATVAAGMLHFALRRSLNVHWQATHVSREERAVLKRQRPLVLWFTGLSGAGKSTVANLLEGRLAARGHHTVLLDGDNLRHGLNRDLGFTDADRIENIRRVGEVARLMTDAGLIVIVALISPFRLERALVREMMRPGEFMEVHIDVPLATAEARDAKGLYAKARAGELKNFTGVDSPYEPPESPEFYVDTAVVSAEAAAEALFDQLLVRL